VHLVDTDDTPGYLTGQLLIAMPNMQDVRFERSVIYLCVHNADGAMGLVINQIADELSFPDLLEQLGIESVGAEAGFPIHVGGPVESGRGFVLHTSDYAQGSTIQVNESVSLTATVDILKDIAEGCGPRRALLALGYAGWGSCSATIPIRSGSNPSPSWASTCRCSPEKRATPDGRRSRLPQPIVPVSGTRIVAQNAEQQMVPPPAVDLQVSACQPLFAKTAFDE
jgi:putative transcriptional regulator